MFTEGETRPSVVGDPVEDGNVVLDAHRPVEYRVVQFYLEGVTVDEIVGLGPDATGEDRSALRRGGRRLLDQVEQIRGRENRFESGLLIEDTLAVGPGLTAELALVPVIMEVVEQPAVGPDYVRT